MGMADRLCILKESFLGEILEHVQINQVRS